MLGMQRILSVNVILHARAVSDALSWLRMKSQLYRALFFCRFIIIAWALDRRYLLLFISTRSSYRKYYLSILYV